MRPSTLRVNPCRLMAPIIEIPVVADPEIAFQIGTVIEAPPICRFTAGPKSDMIPNDPVRIRTVFQVFQQFHEGCACIVFPFF